MENLNDAMIDNADGPAVAIRADHGEYRSADGRIEVHFDLLAERLCQEIKRWPVVVGCVAWLTNQEILDALYQPEQVSILVNKEDFLRPDSISSTYSQQQIRKWYGVLSGIDRYEHPGASRYNYCGDSSTEAVRCVGVSKLRADVPPRLHHKFVVFCDWDISIRNAYDADFVEDEYATPGQWQNTEWVGDEYDFMGGRYASPKAVWTGSFNFSENGRRSLENAVLIRDEGVASQFYAEWVALLGISEPLDWTSVYVQPEYRIGS